MASGFTQNDLKVNQDVAVLDTVDVSGTPLVEAPNVNEYNIAEYQYPSDLFSNISDNYVVFYINVQNDSRIVTTQSEEISEDIPNNFRSIFSGRSVEESKRLSTITTAAEGAIAGGGIGGLLSIGNLFSGVGAGIVAGAVAGALIKNNVLDANTNFGRQTKRLHTAIAMHVPNQLQTSYRMEWIQDQFEISGGAFALGENSQLVRKLSELNLDQVLQNPLSAAANVGIEGLLKDVQGVGREAAQAKLIASSNSLSAIVGQAANPRKEQLFKSPEVRRFNMEYQFFPRSAEEARNIQNIIYQFKRHMHPEFIGEGNFRYRYPSEFDIYFYKNNSENKYLHKFTTSVLTELNINYTPNGMFSTFEDGMPTQINLVMGFLELAVLDRNMIEQGY
jgi:hypothetical protein